MGRAIKARHRDEGGRDPTGTGGAEAPCPRRAHGACGQGRGAAGFGWRGTGWAWPTAAGHAGSLPNWRSGHAAPTGTQILDGFVRSFLMG
jgi:hypothetical protein